MWDTATSVKRKDANAPGKKLDKSQGAGAREYLSVDFLGSVLS